MVVAVVNCQIDEWRGCLLLLIMSCFVGLEVGWFFFLSSSSSTSSAYFAPAVVLQIIDWSTSSFPLFYDDVCLSDFFWLNMTVAVVVVFILHLF